MSLEQDQRISDVVKREQSRLRGFIRRRVPDPRDAEDILQDVFYELVEANRLLMPIEHVTGWLFRVARNRITDLFRKKRPELFSDAADRGRGRRAAAAGGPAAVAGRRTGGALRPPRAPRRARAGGRRAAGGAARGVRRARAGRTQLQGDGRRDRREREHAALAQALCGAASARAVARDLTTSSRKDEGPTWP